MNERKQNGDDHDMEKPTHRHERVEKKSMLDAKGNMLDFQILEKDCIWSNVSSPPQLVRLRLRSRYLSQYVVVVVVVEILILIDALIRIQKRRIFGKRFDLDNLSK